METFKIGDELSHIRPSRHKWGNSQHAQGWVENHPKTTEIHLALAGRRVLRNRTVKLADRAIEVPNEANARVAVHDPLLGFVFRIEAHTEKGGLNVIEYVLRPEYEFKRISCLYIGGRGEEAVDNIPPAAVSKAQRGLPMPR